MAFVTEPPVLSDRISVSGTQWVEAHPDGSGGSRLHFSLSVRCKVRGVGGMVGKGIAEGSLASYRQQPNLALEYVALRRAAADASEAYERASRLSHAVDLTDDETGDDRAPTSPSAHPRAMTSATARLHSAKNSTKSCRRRPSG